MDRSRGRRRRWCGYRRGSWGRTCQRKRGRFRGSEAGCDRGLHSSRSTRRAGDRLNYRGSSEHNLPETTVASNLFVNTNHQFEIQLMIQHCGAVTCTASARLSFGPLRVGTVPVEQVNELAPGPLIALTQTIHQARNDLRMGYSPLGMRIPTASIGTATAVKSGSSAPSGSVRDTARLPRTPSLTGAMRTSGE